jgi:UDP-3-O-[3-hydroxymyristoyl] N-acetylglucosamine deacetylase
MPADADTGTWFLRTDIETEQASIKASWRNLAGNSQTTTIFNHSGVTVSGVDLVLAALRTCGIDNVIIEINGPETPLFDGSSAPLVALINRAGLVPQGLSRFGYWIERPLQVRLGESFAILSPSSVPRMTVNVEFRHAAINSQCISLEMVDHVITREFIPARSLGFDPAIMTPEANGHRFHKQFQSMVMMHNRINPAYLKLRYHDEFARHAMLECFGDLALAGGPLFGHLYVHQPNHRLNHALLRELFANRQSWSRHSYDEILHRSERMHDEMRIQAKLSSMRLH